MKSCLAAFHLLSIWKRLGRDRPGSEQVGSAILYFPLVGVCFGLLLMGCNQLLEFYLQSEILSVALVALLLLMTGGIHTEELQKTFDNLLTYTRSDSDSPERHGIFGLLAVLLVVLFKIRSIEVTGEMRNLSLVFTPVFGRWATIIFAYGAAPARDDVAHAIIDRVRGWHLLLTTVLTLGLASFFVGRLALWVGLCLSLFSLLSREYLQRSKGGLVQENLGAAIELTETFTLVLFASA